MAKKNADRDRQARVEAMRRAEKAKERRRTLLVIGSSLVVASILVGLVVVAIQRSLAERDPAKIGVATAAAACDPVTTDEATGSSVHVGPGTDTPTTTRVAYKQVPAVSGEHFPTPITPALPFYTADDRPPLENLVHNQEHGYTMLWYTSTTPADQVEAMKKLSDIMRDDAATAGKFIVSQWDDSYGAFPAGKTVALSHWGAKQAHRQLCGSLSGQVVKDFVTAYPYTDSPEPNGA